MCVKLLLSICLIKVLWFYEFLINFLASKELKEENSCLQTWIRQKCLKRLLEEYTGETISYSSLQLPYLVKSEKHSIINSLETTRLTCSLIQKGLLQCHLFGSQEFDWRLIIFETQF